MSLFEAEIAMHIPAEQHIVVRPGEMPDEVLQIHKVRRRAKATGERVIGGGYRGPVHRAEMLQQMSFLLEHGGTESTPERLFTRVHSQMSLEVPRHAKLLAAVAASVFAHGIGFRCLVRRRWGRQGSGRRHRPSTPGWLQGGRRSRIGAGGSM